MSQDKSILIKIIGPAKSRKTSIATVINNALREKGFLVNVEDGPNGVELAPSDVYTRDSWGQGLKVRVETVQATREGLEPKEPPTLGAFEDFIRGHLLAIKDEVTRGSQSQAENMLQALLRAFPERT